MKVLFPLFQSNAKHPSGESSTPSDGCFLPPRPLLAEGYKINLLSALKLPNIMGRGRQAVIGGEHQHKGPSIAQMGRTATTAVESVMPAASFASALPLQEADRGGQQRK